jgi:hypothetical protein
MMGADGRRMPVPFHPRTYLEKLRFANQLDKAHIGWMLYVKC